MSPGGRGSRIDDGSLPLSVSAGDRAPRPHAAVGFLFMRPGGCAMGGILALENVRKTFRMESGAEVRALDGVSLDVEQEIG